jgi:hypothetical protein
MLILVFNKGKPSTVKKVYLRAKFSLFKISDFVAFSVLKICPEKGPLFEKLQYSENFTKSA